MNHVVPGRPKGGTNLYIELEKHKLDQIAARNIRMFLEKCAPFSRQSYDVTGEKRTRTNNMISVIRIYLLLSEPGPASQYIMQVRKTFTESFVFSSSKANTLRLKTNLAM